MTTERDQIDAGRRPAAASRTRTLAAGLLLASLCAAARAEAATCTRELTEKEFAGNEAAEVICRGVAVRFMPLRSEMFYRRWSGEVVVRALGEEAAAKIALAAFDAAGDLVGASSLYVRKVSRKPRTIPLRMEGMFTSLSDVERIVVSVTVPSGREP